MRKLSLFVLFTLSVWSTSCGTLSHQAAHRAEWTFVASPHFEIMSTMTVDKTTRLMKKLERFRTLVRAITNARKASPPIPTKIFAFAHRREYSPFSWGRGFAGYFHQGVRSNHVVILDYIPKMDASETVLHEYTHFILRNSTTRYPVWFDEGFAEVLSTATVDKERMIVGGMSSVRAESFVRGRWLKMARILEATSYSSIPQDRLHMFYAEAWALAHYVTLDHPVQGGTARYLSLLQRGEDSQEAYEDAFGESIGTTAMTIRHKLKTGDWRLMAVPLEKLDTDASPLTVRKPTPEEVATRLGLFQISNHKPVKAEALFKQALALNPANARAQAGLGDAYKFQKRMQIAEGHFRKAVELDPDDFLNQLDLAEFLQAVAVTEPKGGQRSRHLQEARSAYATADRLSPGLPETSLMLGRTYLAAGEDASKSTELIERAYRLFPSSQAILESLVEAYVANDQHMKAMRIYAQLASTRHEGSISRKLSEIVESVRAKRAAAEKAYEASDSDVDE